LCLKLNIKLKIIETKALHHTYTTYTPTEQTHQLINQNKYKNNIRNLESINRLLSMFYVNATINTINNINIKILYHHQHQPK
jgi:hypothetical protein